MSVRYQTYAVSSNPAPLVYNADPGRAVHNFVLKENLGTGSFELYDYGDLVHPVFVQAIASTTDIDINADPTVNSSLTIDYSGGVFKNNVNFDGGAGVGPHRLTILPHSPTRSLRQPVPTPALSASAATPPSPA